MRVALVVPDPVPYVFGGAQRVWQGLTDHIREHTPHDADILPLPSPERDLISLVDTYEDFARLDVSAYDLVITSKYPAWMIEHPRHVVYMFHTLRGLYDTYPRRLPPRVEHPDGGISEFLAQLRRVPDRQLVPDVIERFRALVASRGPGDPMFAVPGPFARELIHYLDRAAMAPEHVSRYSAISHTVARRRDYFPAGVPVDVAHPPSALRGLRSGRSDYFFTASRLDPPKRIDFIVEAMGYVSHDIPLKIAGTGPAMEDLRTLAAGDPRIEFLGHVTDDQLVDLYADALAVPFLPLDEDLGLITLEAMLCGKPVVTCFDAGGPTEFVRDGVTGLMPDPAPEWIGQACERLAADPVAARVMGANGRRVAERVTWGHVVEAVLAPAPVRPSARGTRGKPRLVVTSTFPVHPPFGGGQLRCHHLYGSLTDDFDVEIVSLAPPDVAASRTTYAPGFVETVIPKSPEHQAEEDVIGAKIGFAVTDVVADLLTDRSPAYIETLTAALEGAEVGLLAHPFLASTFRRVAPSLPFVYDAHNAEFSLKEAVMPTNPAGRELVEMVRRTEGVATADAIFVSVCSDNDRDLLESEYGPFESVMIPNGVDTVGTHFTPLGQRLRRSAHWRSEMAHLRGIPAGSSACALFVGSWHPPNVDALHTILRLALELPDIAFLVAGSVCSEDVGSARDLPANVAMLGLISNHTKQTLLSLADVALNPMTRGAGTNLKILEYFAAGVPTVSTDIGVRGLDVEDQHHLAIAPVEDFAVAITRIRAERSRVVEMVEAARAMVAAEYEWQILGRRFADAIATRVGVRV